MNIGDLVVVRSKFLSREPYVECVGIGSSIEPLRPLVPKPVDREGLGLIIGIDRDYYSTPKQQDRLEVCWADGRITKEPSSYLEIADSHMSVSGKEF